MADLVEYTSQGGIGAVTIRRPQARNALTWDAMQAFAAAIERAHQDSELSALIVTGEGVAFCAGGDLFELNAYPTRADGARLSAIMASALDRLEALPCPTIAAMEGPALGGGAEIALACDFRVMGEGATFGMMHVRLGLTPAWGGGQRLLRAVGYARALEWLTVGRVLSAAEAWEIGLIQRIAPPGGAYDAAYGLAGSIATNDRETVRSAKLVLQAGLRSTPEEAMRTERNEFPTRWAAPAHLEASADFVARRNHRPRRADPLVKGSSPPR
jgi:enoyl-CoA hydratase/carnithine racemase